LLPVVMAVEITVAAVISVVVMVEVSVAVASLDRVSVSALPLVTTTMATDPILAVFSSSGYGLDADGRCGRSKFADLRTIIKVGKEHQIWCSLLWLGAAGYGLMSAGREAPCYIEADRPDPNGQPAKIEFPDCIGKTRNGQRRYLAAKRASSIHRVESRQHSR
jgi:hypothetical protein